MIETNISRMVTKSLHKQIDQSNQNQDRNGIHTLRMVLIDKITTKVGSNSQTNKVNTLKRMYPNEVAKKEQM